MESDIASEGSDDYIRAMDRRLTVLETRFDTILPTLATKADVERVLVEMHKGFSDMHKWVVGTCIALVLGFGGMSLTMLQMINLISDRVEQTVVAQQRR